MTPEAIAPRKVFSVFLDEREFDVFDIPGREHPGWNGEVKTWWIYRAERLPDGLVPPADSEHFIPLTKGLQRLAWDIQVRQFNYLKCKWDEWDLRSGVRCTMKCNGKTVYEFSAGGTDHSFAYAMAKAQQLQVELTEHPYNFLEPEKEAGRRIYWYGLPAFVSPKKSMGWEIGIVPDYSAGLDRAAWREEYLRRKTSYKKSDEDTEMTREDDHECMASDYINWGDALSDGHIDWFRK